MKTRKIRKIKRQSKIYNEYKINLELRFAHFFDKLAIIHGVPVEQLISNALFLQVEFKGADDAFNIEPFVKENDVYSQ